MLALVTSRHRRRHSQRAQNLSNRHAGRARNHDYDGVPLARRLLNICSSTQAGRVVMFDEMTGSADRGDAVRSPYAELSRWLDSVNPDLLNLRGREAEVLFSRIGITFEVYGDPEAQERLIPFDIIPRILAAEEWAFLHRGLEQRVKAINAYLKDIYSKRDIVRAGIVPGDLI